MANKWRLPSVSPLKCAYFSPVSLVSERVSSFWPRVLSSHHGENRAFEAILLLWNDEDSLWCLTSGFWVGLFLCSRSELLWTKVSTGLQVIPPVSVLSIPYPEDIINHANLRTRLIVNLNQKHPSIAKQRSIISLIIFDAVSADVIVLHRFDTRYNLLVYKNFTPTSTIVDVQLRIAW